MKGKEAMEGKQRILGQRALLIDLSDMDDAHGPCAMSFGFELAPLCESIQEIGLVHPPCIVKEGKGQIAIVTGYRRILALKQLGWSKVACEDVSSALRSPLERLLFAFHENRAARAFNPVEKGMILKRLEPLLGKEEVLNRFMPLLSLPSHEGTLRFYVELAGMKRQCLDALASGRLSLNAARLLLDLKPDSAECAFQTLSKLALNFNQQVQFIDMMNDLSEINRKSFSRILDEDPLRAVLASDHLNTPQKAKKLLEELRSLRYPRWQNAEQRFRKRLDRLSLPEGTRIDHPSYFEAPGYRLEVRFRDGESLTRKLQHLAQVSGLRDFRDPVDEDD